jgi:hypothetical protein
MSNQANQSKENFSNYFKGEEKESFIKSKIQKNNTSEHKLQN